MRSLPLLLKFLTDAGIIPESVLAECIDRLGYGAPARGPTVERMAAVVDRYVGVRVAGDLYDRYYRPASSLAMHSGGLALLRHVRPNDSVSRRPARSWARRLPARIADACLGALTANLARRSDSPSRLADSRQVHQAARGPGHNPDDCHERLRRQQGLSSSWPRSLPCGQCSVTDPRSGHQPR
jgi:hypothetical protein